MTEQQLPRRTATVTQSFDTQPNRTVRERLMIGNLTYDDDDDDNDDDES